jgi:hypothetical protein
VAVVGREVDVLSIRSEYMIIVEIRYALHTNRFQLCGAFGGNPP